MSNRVQNNRDYCLASPNPPGGLLPEQVPQFICFGFDDNRLHGIKDGSGFIWIINLFSSRKNPAGSNNKKTYDGTPIRYSFFVNSIYLDSFKYDDTVHLKNVWRLAFEKGNEIGIHTHSHKSGKNFTLKEWEYEIQKCIDIITQIYLPDESIDNPDNSKGIGVSLTDLIGFRAPYLEYNDNTYIALKKKNIIYDCSIHEGFQEDQDGTDYYWPYTLDKGSPGNKLFYQWNSKPLLKNHAGLWEIPVYTVIVPPDEKCELYGIAPGLRQRLEELEPSIVNTNGKIAGFDWNLWYFFKMTRKEEVLAILKYSLDLRLNGNRCPMTFGVHGDIYSKDYHFPSHDVEFKERQMVLREFIDYALAKPEVRIVSMKELLEWLRKPVALGK